jgi:hypothetical protein
VLLFRVQENNLRTEGLIARGQVRSNRSMWLNCSVYISLNSEYLAHLLGLVQRIGTMAPRRSTLLRNGSSTGGSRLLSFLVKQTRQRTSCGLLEKQADSATYFAWTLGHSQVGRRWQMSQAERAFGPTPFGLTGEGEGCGEDVAGRPSREGGEEAAGKSNPRITQNGTMCPNRWRR